MPLITIVITLIVAGVLLWLINTYIPMDATIKKILNLVVVLVVIFWLLNAFGVWGKLRNVRVSIQSPPWPGTTCCVATPGSRAPMKRMRGYHAQSQAVYRSHQRPSQSDNYL